MVSVNGVSHGGSFEKCRDLIVTAGTTLTLTVLRRQDGPAESLGELLGSWNVAMSGNGTLFVTAFKIETEGFGARRFGLLLVLQRIVENVRYAIFVPADELTKVCAEHFGASLLAPSKALELAKLFANLVEMRRLPSGAPMAPLVPPELAHYHYVLRTPDNTVLEFAWAAVCLDGDSMQVCFQRAAHVRETRLAATSASSKAAAEGAESVAAADPSAAEGTAEAVAVEVVSRLSVVTTVRKYTLAVDDLGTVAGVPPEVIKLLTSGNAVGEDGKAGERVQVDFQGSWTNATIISADDEPTVPAATTSSLIEASEGEASHQFSALSEDSDDDEDGNKAGTEKAAAVASEDDGMTAEEHSLTDEMLEDEVKGVMSHEEFKDNLLRGIQVIKFNRRGQAAFRTLTLIGDHSLTWMTPKDAIAAGYGGEHGINPHAKVAISQAKNVQ